MKTSKPLSKPTAIEIVYTKELWSLVSKMIKDYKSLLSIYSRKEAQVAMDSETWLTTEIHTRLKRLGDKWEKAFEEYAKTHTKQYVEKILKMTDTQLKSVLSDFYSQERLTLIGQTVPAPLKQSINAHINENVSLITSIPAQFLERITFSVNKSIYGGGSLAQLTKDISKYGDMTMRRAKLIATDQTRKIYSNLTVRRFQQVGVYKMKWLHSGAVKHPRDYHKRKWDGKSGLKDGKPNGLNGFIFEINDPPVIDLRTGERGYPADLINCSCVGVAVIE